MLLPSGFLPDLDSELLGWLTTVSPDGRPQSSAIWFLRDGAALLMYSSSGATRLGNLAGNPHIAFNLRADPGGERILTMEGIAEVNDAAPTPQDNPAYMAKYGTEIIRLGWTPESFGADYPVPVVLRFSRARSWG